MPAGKGLSTDPLMYTFFDTELITNRVADSYCAIPELK